MDFEKVFTILVFFGGMVGITLALTAGIVALRRRVARDRLEFDRVGAATPQEELEELRARVEDLERRGLVSGEVESQYATAGRARGTRRLCRTPAGAAQRTGATSRGGPVGVNKGGSKVLGMLLVIALAGMSLVYLGGTISELSRRGLEFVLAALAGGGVFFWLMLRGPVGKAIASLLEGDTPNDEELVMRVEDLEARLAELSLEQQRVGELEERLDFAERLLATREPGLLEGRGQ